MLKSPKSHALASAALFATNLIAVIAAASNLPKTGDTAGAAWLAVNCFAVIACAVLLVKCTIEAVTTSGLKESEIGFYDLMVARVRAGEPIHIQGPDPESLGHALLGQVERLKRETGMPVHVIFS